jgi:hypothetical protein
MSLKLLDFCRRLAIFLSTILRACVFTVASSDVVIVIG